MKLLEFFLKFNKKKENAPDEQVLKSNARRRASQLRKKHLMSEMRIAQELLKRELIPIENESTGR